MNLAAHLYRLVVSGISSNPSGTAATLIFGLGFAIVAGNALFSQASEHPDPIWATQDGMATRSIVETVRVDPVGVNSEPSSITRNVLTQRISLRNIPVPTSRPDKSVLQKDRKPGAASVKLLREIQEHLADLGFYKGKVDGILGIGSKQAIIEYQSSANILADGEVTYELLTHIRSFTEINRRLSEQTVRTEVKSEARLTMPQSADFDRKTILRIQTALKDEFGIEEIELDGVFGNQTRSALKEFQRFFKLEQSGEIDRATLEKLQSTGIITAI